VSKLNEHVYRIARTIAIPIAGSPTWANLAQNAQLRGPKDD
jgi:hypothetical protein